ncbi:ubs1p [Saccharomyces arboricola H-6]|uniref:Ubs1p n=1 Tax=Saccharomyces arboricola (strain H-6 / AS 2.3317 / CBS 10644) TaxID=1160507 RepID=J8Q4Z9_SACAR|nr:ubs1p [Saccharomyces arboricola H-6]
MPYLLTRKLLKDWKYLMRHPERTQGLYHIRPHESDLHLWHVVFYEPRTSLEVYLLLYIGGNDQDPYIIMKCLSPNSCFPINRTVSMTHLNYLLLKDLGLQDLLSHIWQPFFHVQTVDDIRYSPSVVKFNKAWNRIIYKDFKSYFPELIGTLQPGDYAIIKSYIKLHNINNSNSNSVNEFISFYNTQNHSFYPQDNNEKPNNNNNMNDSSISFTFNNNNNNKNTHTYNTIDFINRNLLACDDDSINPVLSSKRSRPLPSPNEMSDNGNNEHCTKRKRI